MYSLLRLKTEPATRDRATYVPTRFETPSFASAVYAMRRPPRHVAQQLNHPTVGSLCTSPSAPPHRHRHPQACIVGTMHGMTCAGLQACIAGIMHGMECHAGSGVPRMRSAQNQSSHRVRTCTSGQLLPAPPVPPAWPIRTLRCVAHRPTNMHGTAPHARPPHACNLPHSALRCLNPVSQERRGPSFRTTGCS